MAKRSTTEIVIEPGQLWPKTPWGSQMQIEVFGATSEFGIGKTILGASIAPGSHPEGHPFAGQPRTLNLDLEKSGTSYAGIGWKRIDVPAEMARVYGPNYTPKQVAEWFNAIPTKVKPGQYDVCMVDPINDIESGQVDIVKANPTAYGYTKGQIDSSVALLMAAMKAHYKKLLMAFVPNVFKCLYFTTHLRDEFKGAKPTGNRQPRGKETLFELASLYLWLKREPDQKLPSAIVMKHRLSDTRVNESGELEVVELMPRRIPVATVQAIRRYIANPPDIAKPASGEKVIEKPATEEDLIRLRLATAEAQTAAAQAQATVLERQRELAAIRQVAQGTTPQAADQTAAARKAAEEKREAAAREAAEAAARAAADLAATQAEGQRLAAAADIEHQKSALVADGKDGTLAERFKAAFSASGVSPERLKLAFAASGCERFTQCSESRQAEILAWLDDLAACQSLVQALGLDDAKVKQLCARANAERIADLNGPVAAMLRSTLQKALDGREAAAKN